MSHQILNIIEGCVYTLVVSEKAKDALVVLRHAFDPRFPGEGDKLQNHWYVRDDDVVYAIPFIVEANPSVNV